MLCTLSLSLAVSDEFIRPVFYSQNYRNCSVSNGDSVVNDMSSSVSYWCDCYRGKYNWCMIINNYFSYEPYSDLIDVFIFDGIELLRARSIRSPNTWVFQYSDVYHRLNNTLNQARQNTRFACSSSMFAWISIIDVVIHKELIDLSLNCILAKTRENTDSVSCMITRLIQRFIWEPNSRVHMQHRSLFTSRNWRIQMIDDNFKKRDWSMTISLVCLLVCIRLETMIGSTSVLNLVHDSWEFKNSSCDVRRVYVDF
jgi:hypothetical protein